MEQKNTKGSFTLPGESGYEALTLQLAEKWGADVIRDSDGTELSEEILNAGHQIYSTICIIREHNDFAKQNPHMLQQSFLITQPKIASEGSLSLYLMEDFFSDQFSLNTSEESMKYWQVYDRTTSKEIERTKWHFDRETNQVVITGVTPWHSYTVSFLAYRIWEEISMYNHTTNNWNKEHLMQIDPMHRDVQRYLLKWMENWCETHSQTNVVRFTSMFYNFVWIWGSNPKNKYLFSDWGSYDFTVSPIALALFAEKYGYFMQAEDFVNGGKYQVSHMPPSKHKRDWMNFINDFVIEFGKKLIDIVHSHNKLAYVFYDDSWVGIEPYHPRFKEFGFDGLIKCVFSGFEVRLCAGVAGLTHELRLHPYLFPVGLGGLPTFMEGGNPTLEAKKFWNSIRRALLRAPIERIGLGGYLHLVENYPDFCDYIEKISNEFRAIKELHALGAPNQFNTRIGILHSWGKLRSWTLSGHFHETHMHDLIHVLEALSGMPFEIQFIDFEDVKTEQLSDIDIIINAGTANSAWSGGYHWNDAGVVQRLTEWVYKGGTFIGINQPSAVDGFDTYYRMAPVLGVDEDTGARVSHGKWEYTLELLPRVINDQSFIHASHSVYLTDGEAKVVSEQNGVPSLTIRDFGAGKGIYMASFETSLANNRMLMELLLYASHEEAQSLYITDNLNTECAYFETSDRLVVINNSYQEQTTSINVKDSLITVSIAPFDTLII